MIAAAVDRTGEEKTESSKDSPAHREKKSYHDSATRAKARAKVQGVIIDDDRKALLREINKAKRTHYEMNRRHKENYSDLQRKTAERAYKGLLSDAGLTEKAFKEEARGSGVFDD